jgi:hypothetical protein
MTIGHTFMIAQDALFDTFVGCLTNLTYKGPKQGNDKRMGTGTALARGRDAPLRGRSKDCARSGPFHDGSAGMAIDASGSFNSASRLVRSKGLS